MANLTTRTADTTPTSDDLLYTVHDPSGTPADRKVTAGDLIKKAHGLSDAIVKVASGIMAAATPGTDFYAPGSTDVAVTDGGTGASTAAGARANLGVPNIAGDTFTGPINFSGTTNAGLIFNSLTTTQRDALTPQNGMVIYNTSINAFQKYENGAWGALSGISSFTQLSNLPVIDARAYGVVADGVTDDRAALITAIAAVPATGGILELPAGNIYISQKIDITRGNIWIRGNGLTTTKMTMDITAPGNNYFIRFNGAAGVGNHLQNIFTSDFATDCSSWSDGTTRLNTGTLQVGGYIYKIAFTATGGTFTVSFNGSTTAAVAYNATTGTLQTALEGLASIGVGNVTVSGSAGAYRVELAGTLVNSYYPLTASGTNLTGVSSSLAVRNIVKLAAGASSTNDELKNCTFCTVEDSVNGFAVGTAGSIFTYDGTSKEAEVSLLDYAPSSSAKYGILLINNLVTHASNGDDQTIRGIGRIGFYYCDNVRVFNLHSYGGHGWIDWTRTDYVHASHLSCVDVQENALNCLGGTDATSEQTCEYYVVSNCNFESGEGFDCAVDYATISNIVWKSIGYGDEALDLNASHYVTVNNITSIGGNHAINLHGAPSIYDSANASYYVSLSNVVARNFLTSGISFRYGAPTNSGFTVSLGSPSAGTFTLTKGGFTTSAIAYNASAATVKSAIEALSGMGAGTCVVTGNAGGPYTVGFKAGYEGALTGSGASLTGGTFLITNISQSSQDGACHDIVITNCSLTSTVTGAVGVEASWTSTSLPVRVDDVNISNLIVNTDGNALVASYNKNLTVRDGTFRSISGVGVYANHATYQNNNVRIINCRIKGKATNTTSGGGIYFGNALYPVIRNNVIEDVLTQGYAIHVVNCKAPIVEFNEVFNSQHHGIYVEWTASTNIDSDFDIRTSIVGNKVYNFGSATTGRYGIGLSLSFANTTTTYFGGVFKDNYVTLATASASQTAFRISNGWSSSGYMEVNFTGNRTSDSISNNTNKVSVAGQYTATTVIRGNSLSQATVLTTQAVNAQCRLNLQGWYANGVTLSTAATAMTYAPGAGASHNPTAWIAPRSGSIVGVSINLSSQNTAGTITCTVYKNGSTTTTVTVVAGTNVTNATTMVAPLSVTFAAGDKIEVYVSSNASQNPSPNNVRASIDVDVV